MGGWVHVRCLAADFGRDKDLGRDMDLGCNTALESLLRCGVCGNERAMILPRATMAQEAAGSNVALEQLQLPCACNQA